MLAHRSNLVGKGGIPRRENSMILERRAFYKSGSVQGLGRLRRVFRGFSVKITTPVPLNRSDLRRRVSIRAYLKVNCLFGSTKAVLLSRSEGRRSRVPN